ncbi:MAG: fibronectin type III domain-containing protein [Actinobacteria bacterium]|nr:fibronectin type III domain-containing protein [Actinomycetota bacterium]
MLFCAALAAAAVGLLTTAVPAFAAGSITVTNVTATCDAHLANTGYSFTINGSGFGPGSFIAASVYDSLYTSSQYPHGQVNPVQADATGSFVLPFSAQNPFQSLPATVVVYDTHWNVLAGPLTVPQPATCTIAAPLQPANLAGPSSPTTATSASITWGPESDDGNTTGYQCSLNGSAWVTCASGVTYLGLTPGSYSFQVEATGPGGVSTPATFQWTVSAPAPGTPTNLTGPTSPTTSTSASLSFAGDANTTGFLCSIDNGAFASCTSPATYSGLATGSHTFQVEATGPGGTSSPATYSWTINSATGCTAVGDVHGEGHWQVMATDDHGHAHQVDAHVNVDADCDAADSHHPTTYLHHANVQFDSGNGVHWEAKTDDHNHDVQSVTITGGNTASVVVNVAGTSYTITLVDGGEHNNAPNHGDSVTAPWITGTPDHFDVHISND